MSKRLNDEVKTALAELESRRGGLLPEDVINAARNKNSPLHSQFEWDDRKAAIAHRLEQARELIRAVTVEYHIGERTYVVPAYVHDPDKGNAAGYISVAKLRRDPEGSHAALVQEFSAAGSHLRRARDLAVVLGYGKELDKLVKQYDAVKSVIEEAEQVS